jgi:hypothetical protein
VIDPLVGIGLVNGDDLRHGGFVERYLKVQGASTGRESQQQCAGGILLIRIVLDQLGGGAGLADLLLADIALDGTAKGMTTELEFPGIQLSLDFL